MTKEKNVYFMRPVGERGPVKIGCSCEPEKRLRSVEIWSPLKLEIAAFVPGGHREESILHQMFGADRLHGEWFNCSEQLASVIEFCIRTGKLPPLDYSLDPYKVKRSNPNAKSAMTRRISPADQRCKSRITAKLLKAERRVYGFASTYMRPDEIEDIYQSYQGSFSSLPSAEQLEMLEEYIGMLEQLPSAQTNFAGWKDWHKMRLVIREQAA